MVLSEARLLEELVEDVIEEEGFSSLSLSTWLGWVSCEGVGINLVPCSDRLASKFVVSTSSGNVLNGSVIFGDSPFSATEKSRRRRPARPEQARSSCRQPSWRSG